MPFLTKDEILGADDLPFKDVDCPEWKGTVRVRTMTGDERDAFESSLLGPDGKPTRKLTGLRALLVSLTVTNDKNERLFTEADVEALGRKSSKALNRVFAAAQSLNGLSQADVGELTKN